jgi:hypothetical protein
MPIDSDSTAEGTHTVLSPFPLGKSSQASYSLAGAREAVVFLHGYSGAPVKTWIAFPELLSGFQPFEGLDLIFCGYDSVAEHTESCADRFKTILEQLLVRPASPRRPASIPRHGTAPYERILIVAHSMGAVVARRALILADEDGLAWTAQVRLVLYAPAHHGARLELADSFLSGLLGKIWAIGRFHSPAIDQLRSGSTYLTELALDVERALSQVPKPSHLVALKVIHARRETVLVHPESRFGEDPRSRLIDGTHMTVCKPSSATSPAIEELREVVEIWL